MQEGFRVLSGVREVAKEDSSFFPLFQFSVLFCLRGI